MDTTYEVQRPNASIIDVIGAINKGLGRGFSRQSK